MAFRYRQITPQTLDLINPDDWNVNVREYTNELNGHLDRDNLPEKGITTASIKPDVFHIVKSDLTTTNQVIDKSEARFKEFQIIEFETQHQGILMCEWSGGWTYEVIEETLTSSDVQMVDYRILVNGTEVTRIRNDNNLKKKSVGYMVGSIPVEAGMVKVTVEIMTRRKYTHSVVATGIDYAAMQTANGNVTINNRSLIVVLRKA
tara:strand:+ start:1286 stop:1900 length:615 start_codon:yes stop_codon:yes gene_type:complete